MPNNSNTNSSNTLQALISILGSFRFGGHPAYRIRLDDPATGWTPSPKARPDSDQAALGLEAERRGYTVHYCARSGLPENPAPNQIGRNMQSSWNVDRHEAWLAVNDPTAVAHTQAQMRQHPQEFREVATWAKRDVDSTENFDRIATKAMHAPMRAASNLQP